MAFPKIGNMAPAFSLPNQDGNKVALKDFRDDRTWSCTFIPRR
jgi:peroxiredoxin Q/BCP